MVGRRGTLQPLCPGRRRAPAPADVFPAVIAAWSFFGSGARRILRSRPVAPRYCSISSIMVSVCGPAKSSRSPCRPSATHSTMSSANSSDSTGAMHACAGRARIGCVTCSTPSSWPAARSARVPRTSTPAGERTKSPGLKRPRCAAGESVWITGDLATGDGLGAAVAGVAVIVHAGDSGRRARTRTRSAEGRDPRGDHNYQRVALERGSP
jgi:hypothetical protein